MVRTAVLVAVTAVGFLAGTARHGQSPLQAQGRRSAPREAFLSGSERALPVLMEISATLKRIEERLAKIEQSVTNRDEP
jgi:hypothetical protein